jgi:hypothetical protein
MHYTCGDYFKSSAKGPMTNDGFFNGSMTIDELVRETHGRQVV